MGIFRSHREAARANNRVIGRFYLVIAIWTLVFAAAVAGHYMFGWW
jgi:hypothetical protein